MRSDLCGNPEEIRHELDLPLNGASAYSRNLPIPNYVYRFVSPDCSPRCVESKEAESGINSSSDEPMVMLDDIIEVLRLSQLSEVGEGSFFIQCVLAGNGFEKSKNGPLALASERRRRVESAPSPMKKDPNQNSTDSAEIEALINRLERGQLRDEEGGHE